MEEKLKRIETVKTINLQQCLKLHGAIYVPNVIHLNYIRCVETQNANLEGNLLLLLDNFSSKELDSKINYQKFFEENQTAWNESPQPAINATAPVFGMALAAKAKNPAVGQCTINTSKNISGGEHLSLTDM